MPKDLMRVCREWFPKTNGFLIDIKLKQQIDIMVNNVVFDWDFTIIVTGGGEVRVGKSVLALQIAIYWTYSLEKVHGITLPFSLKENIVFHWNRLIEQGNALGKKSKYCALQYDEAGETMEGTKTQTMELKAVRDYLRECGQYNFLNILVMPEFFDLPKGIAITRSIFLIDVYYTADKKGIFQRGYFKFYSRRQKKKLYLKGKKELNYNAAPYNFDGEFRNFYPVNEKEYRKLKQEALQAREAGVKDKVKVMFAACLYLLRDMKVPQKEIRALIWKLTGLRLPKSTCSDYVEKIRVLNKKKKTEFVPNL